MAGIKINQLQHSRIESTKKLPSATSFSVMEFMNQDISFFSKLNDKHKESFYHELAILLKAGIDLKSGLDLIVIQQQKKQIITLFEKIREDIIHGASLSIALQKHRDFTAYEYFSIQIGEETGKLSDVMEELALFFRKRLKQKRQISSALMYPAMVTLTSFAAVFFMMNFIVPMFADIFQRSGSELPWITKLIVSVSDLFRAYFLMFSIALIGIVLFFVSKKNTVWFRKGSSQLLLSLPIFGPMIRKIYLARFCNAMALLTGAKVSLTRALQLCRQMVGFYPIEHSLSIVESAIMEGQSLHKSLSSFDIYDIKLISLIKVGEEVNQLSNFFEKIANQYNDEIEHQSGMISALLEPFIIIILGLFVGFILIAMYLPLFQLGSSFT